MLPDTAVHLVNASRVKVVYDSVRASTGRRHAPRSWRLRDDQRRKAVKQSPTSRVLIKTLLNAGIITERPARFYGMYVDMDELKTKAERMVGDDIAGRASAICSRSS